MLARETIYRRKIMNAVATRTNPKLKSGEIKTITDLTNRTQINRIEFIDDRGLLLLYLDGVWTSFTVPTSRTIEQTYLAIKINGCLAMMIDTRSNTICADPIQDFFKSL